MSLKRTQKVRETKDSMKVCSFKKLCALRRIYTVKADQLLKKNQMLISALFELLLPRFRKKCETLQLCYNFITKLKTNISLKQIH